MAKQYTKTFRLSNSYGGSDIRIRPYSEMAELIGHVQCMVEKSDLFENESTRPKVLHTDVPRSELTLTGSQQMLARAEAFIRGFNHGLNYSFGKRQ